MKNIIMASLSLLSILTFPPHAHAHFMVTYTPEMSLQKAKPLDIRILFTHPAEAGLMMNMGGIKEFYAVYQSGDGKPKHLDFKSYLKEITWQNPDSSATAYAAKIPAKAIRSMGDYVFIVTPGYYLEKEEDV